MQMQYSTNECKQSPAVPGQGRLVPKLLGSGCCFVQRTKLWAGAERLSGAWDCTIQLCQIQGYGPYCLGTYFHTKYF